MQNFPKNGKTVILIFGFKVSNLFAYVVLQGQQTMMKVFLFISAPIQPSKLVL